MKDKITVKQLFDYQGFAHKDFFDKHEYPWEIILELDNYLSSQSSERIVGEGTVIDPSVKIDGPVIIGKNCVIEDNVLLRGGCILGDGVHIGHAVELKHSIILDNTNRTKVSHLVYIGDSIVGRNVNVGGGVIVANWRLDKKNIVVKMDGDRMDTGTAKFGAAIGDGSGIGANAVINPGTVLGKDSIVYPLTSVFGVKSSNSVLK